MSEMLKDFVCRESLIIMELHDTGNKQNYRKKHFNISHPTPRRSMIRCNYLSNDFTDKGFRF